MPLRTVVPGFAPGRPRGECAAGTPGGEGRVSAAARAPPAGERVPTGTPGCRL
jgi:hypothetical protein